MTQSGSFSGKSSDSDSDLDYQLQAIMAIVKTFLFSRVDVPSFLHVGLAPMLLLIIIPKSQPTITTMKTHNIVILLLFM